MYANHSATEPPEGGKGANILQSAVRTVKRLINGADIKRAWGGASARTARGSWRTGARGTALPASLSSATEPGRMRKNVTSSVT